MFVSQKEMHTFEKKNSGIMKTFSFVVMALALCSCFETNKKVEVKEDDSYYIVQRKQGTEEEAENSADENFSYQQFRDITGLVEPGEFYKLILECDSVLIFDARPSEVYLKEPRINDAQLISNYRKFRENVGKLDRDHLIMVYCGLEIRSPGVIKILVNMGFNNVYELKGGLQKWKKLKLPMVTAEGKPYEYKTELKK